MTFFASEIIGFGVGIPVALLYAFVISPVFINSANYASTLIKYAGIFGAIIVVFIAMPINFILSRSLSFFIDRFYNSDTGSDEVVKYFKKLHRLSYLHGFLIFSRILIGAICVALIIHYELNADIYTSATTMLLGLHGAFLAGIVGYIAVLRLVNPVILDIVSGDYLPDDITSKKKSFGIPLLVRLITFIIAPLTIETLTLSLVFLIIYKHNFTSLDLMFRLIVMVIMNFFFIFILIFVYYYQLKFSIKSITRSMLGFLSESGDLTKSIDTTLEDDISYVAYLYNKISKNISHLIKEVKTKSKDVSTKIEDVFSPLNIVVNTSSETYNDSISIKKKTEHQIELVKTSVENTEKMSRNAEELGRFAIDFNDSLKTLLNNVDSIIERLIKLKDNSRKSMDTIETGINNANTIGQHLNLITGANEQVKTTVGEISQVIIMIEDIANQTNILSMNASIEASHAGESGKGFSVVAREIKKLANQSRDNARNTSNQIKNLIEGIENSSATSNSAIEEIKSNLVIFENIREFYGMLNEFFEEQSNIASKLKNEISRTLEKMEQLVKLVEEQQRFVLNTSENIKSVGSSSSEIDKYIHDLSEHLESLIKDIQTSMISLQNTQKLDEELLEKFNQFKID